MLESSRPYPAPARSIEGTFPLRPLLPAGADFVLCPLDLRRIFPRMVPVLEAVPNFSEGRDPELIREIVGVIAREGADVLDWSSDPDHHRSVVTYIGDPRTVEAASVAAARVALEAIDLRRHEGVHPRVGALDVLPFIPLSGLTLDDAARSARDVAARLAEIGIPSYLYGRASDPPGRRLAPLRRGGFELLLEGFPPGREPDFLPDGWPHPGAHPSAGVSCVGARGSLLAWNVFVEGVDEGALREIARSLRETGGGFTGLRALGLVLPSGGRMQISMNLEEPDRLSPLEVFRAIELRVGALGGRVAGTEVIGMIPEALVLPAAADRLGLQNAEPARLLCSRLSEHLAGRNTAGTAALKELVASAGSRLPREVREAADRLIRSLEGISTAG